MAEKDVLSKHLLDLLLPSITKHVLHWDVISTEHLSTETQRVEDRRADLVAKVVPREGGPFILHIEVQSSNHPQMHIRMLRYLTDILLAHPGYDVRQYLVYMGAKSFSMRTGLENMENLSYYYDVIDFQRVSYHTFHDMDEPEALALAILCDFGAENLEHVVDRLFQRLYQLVGDDERRSRECLYMMDVFSKNRDIHINFGKAYNMLDIHLEELSGYQEGLSRGLKEGLEEGREEGREEGILAGKRQIARSLLAMQLSYEQIALLTQLPLAEIKALASGQGSCG